MNKNKITNEIFANYIRNIEEDLKERWNNWDKVSANSEKYEVIGGLMSRQISLAINFLNNSSVWNVHIAPIIIRSMIDNYINFAWIWEDPVERSKKFIYFGLGKEKQQLEFLKNELLKDSGNTELKKQVEAIENWINSQRFTFLTEVSLKSWSEIPVRQMAEESDCLDIYNKDYQLFSSAVHNTWNHIVKFNLVESANPLHKYSRKPGIYNYHSDLNFAICAASYVDKVFRLFDEKSGYNTFKENSFDTFLNALSSLNDELIDEKAE